MVVLGDSNGDWIGPKYSLCHEQVPGQEAVLSVSETVGKPSPQGCYSVSLENSAFLLNVLVLFKPFIFLLKHFKYFF